MKKRYNGLFCNSSVDELERVNEHWWMVRSEYEMIISFHFKIHWAGVPKTGEDWKTSEWETLGMLCDYYMQIIDHGLSQIHDVVQKSLGENRNVCCENTALGHSVAWSRSLIRNKNVWFVLDIDTVSNLKRGKSNNECMGFLWACRLLVLCLITFEYIIFTKLKCCIMNNEIWLFGGNEKMFVKTAIVIGSFCSNERENENMWAFPEKRRWPIEMIKKIKN